MAKLNIELDLKFTTSALIVLEDFEEKNLDAKASIELLDSISIEDLRFEVVSTNEDAEMSIEFSSKDGKRNAVFEVCSNGDDPGLRVKINGQFSRTLRRGADSVLKEMGENLDLRLRGVTWKGGFYNGFTAPVLGGDFAQKSQVWRDSFPRVDRYSIG